MPTGMLSYIGAGAKPEEGNRNLVIVGCGDYGEIWAEDKYAEYVDSMDLGEIRDVLEANGL